MIKSLSRSIRLQIDQLYPGVFAVCLALLVAYAGPVSAAEEQQGDSQSDSPAKACQVLADKRVEEPLTAIAKEYTRRTGLQIDVKFLPADEVDKLVKKKETGADVVVCMPKEPKAETPVAALPGAKAVAWKHPSRLPVWTAAITKHPEAARFAAFTGGPTGHRIWANAKAGFTMVTGKNAAEAFDWVVEHRVKHTYPLTAMRMLREIGGIRDGICIDIGCGSGILDIELAKRSNFKIIGLDIDPDQKPLFDKRIREAGLDKRVSFVLGDAQKLPFPDNYADAIVSRGTLTFIPDIKKCLLEVDRVLKPTGVAFLGGRYLYTSLEHKISNEKLKKIVADSGLSNAKVVEHRGQWVKIVGPKAPEAARKDPGGPQMLAHRFVADYAVTDGDCLMICGGSDGGLQQGMMQGFLEMTEVKITAMYSKKEVARQAEERIRKAKLDDRVTCKVGEIEKMPFEEGSFDVVVGVGPMLIFADRQKAMKEIYRVLRRGGVSLVGGKFLGMPEFRKVKSETLRQDAAKTGISSIRISDDMGQWVEIRKGIKDRGLQD